MQRKLCRTNVNVILWEIKQGNFRRCHECTGYAISLGMGDCFRNFQFVGGLKVH